MRARVAAGVAVAAVVAGLAAGCGSDGTEQEAGPPPPSPPAATTAATTAPAETSTGAYADPLAGAGTQAVSANEEATTIALLDRVAVARHEGYDRVVFQFRNRLPGYRVRYVQPPLHEDGSGDRVDVAGSAFVLVTMEPASGFDVETGEGQLVYDGPRRITAAQAGTATVREVVRTGDFEAALNWAVGLDGRVGFRVLRLDGPPRLVVDFRNR